MPKTDNMALGALPNNHVPQWLKSKCGEYEMAILRSKYLSVVRSEDYEGCALCLDRLTGTGFVHTMENIVAARNIIAHHQEPPTPYYFSWHHRGEQNEKH